MRKGEKPLCASNTNNYRGVFKKNIKSLYDKRIDTDSQKLKKY